MLHWIPYPFIRISAVFISGLLLGIYNEGALDIGNTLLAEAIFVTLYFILWVTWKNTRFVRFNMILSMVGFMAILGAGYLIATSHDDTRHGDHIIHHSYFDAYQAKVIEPAHQTDKTNRYLMEVVATHHHSWEIATGRVYLYIDKSYPVKYQYGDVLMVYGQPNLINEPQNPGEFNYKRFLRFKNIYHQQYKNKNGVALINTSQGVWWKDHVYRAREWATQVLSERIATARERSIALALVLGVKDGLTDDIKQAYAASGTMHILAVSGLHVGIIYGIILLLFRAVNLVGKRRWYLAVVSLICLWFYAAVTGFSPSVLRAVTMFSVIAIAKATSRSVNIYNTLAASACILLLFDPYLIMSLGFQLSYLAVFGIVYFQPKVYSLMLVKSTALDKIWLITSVSIAAQLTTFPLGLLYFHQFPSFFLVSNLIAIPGALLMLTGGLLLLASNAIAPIAVLVGEMLEVLIFCVNEIIFWLQKLPYSLITDIYISPIQSLLLFFMILGVTLLFQFRNVRCLFFSVVATTVFSYLQWKRIETTNTSEKMTIYKVGNHTAIDIISKGSSMLFTDAELSDNFDKLSYHIFPNQLRSGVFTKKIEPLKVDDNELMTIQIGTRLLTILDQPIKQFLIDDNAKTDYLLLTKGYKGNITEVVNVFNPDLIILDGALGRYSANYLKSQLESDSVNHYSVYHQGALNIEI